MPTFFERRQLVAPGDLLAEGNYFAGENTFKNEEKVYSTSIGLVEFQERRVFEVALKAFYVPRVEDIVIGGVTDVTIGGWIVDINSPYPALLRASDVMERSYRPQRNNLTSIFDIGDILIAKIVSYDRTRDPLLTVRESDLGKVTRGQIVGIIPSKIPRLIGKKGSMITTIKSETGCHIVIGQNGRVLVSGKTVEDEQLAIMAIQKVEEESHTSGLTNRVAELLKERSGR